MMVVILVCYLRFSVVFCVTLCLSLVQRINGISGLIQRHQSTNPFIPLIRCTNIYLYSVTLYAILQLWLVQRINGISGLIQRHQSTNLFFCLKTQKFKVKRTLT